MRFARSGLDERREEIDFVIRMHVLEHGRQPLEAHAGIDARRGSGVIVNASPLLCRSNCMNTRFQISM